MPIEGEHGSSGFGFSRGCLGKEEANLFTGDGGSHHHSSGEIDRRVATSFTCKSGEDFVDTRTLVGRVARREASRAGDQMAAVICITEGCRGFVPSHA